MEVAEYQDNTEFVYRQWIPSGGFQVHLPGSDANPIFPGNSPRFLQALSSPITTDHIEALLRNEDAVLALGARQIEDRSRKLLTLKKVKIFHEEC